MSRDRRINDVDFSGDYNPYAHEGVTTVKYVFYNAAPPKDSVIVFIEYGSL